MAEQLAVVTGGAGGLGRVISGSLARLGLAVVVADLDRDAASGVLAELPGSGHSFMAADLSEADEVRRLMARVADLGPLGVLVNNAGGWLPGAQYPGAAPWVRCLDLNLVTPMLACQLALPLMAAGGGGGIVNVASSGGWGSRAYGSPEYGAAKAGLIRFTTSVGDWADRFGVRVNCVVPHWIGLERAVREFGAMTEDERRRSGGLVDPQLVAETVTDLALDPGSSGRVVVLRPDHDPYDVDPGVADPYEEPRPRAPNAA